MPPEAEALFHIPVQKASVAVEELKPEPEAAQLPPEPPAAPAPEPSSPATRTPEWIIEARRVDLFAVARTIGIDIVPQQDKPGFALAPCPACGDDAGAAVEMNSRWNTRVWKCPSCKSFGGNLDLASLTLMGSTLGELDDEGQAAVRGWFSARGWCDPE